MPRSSLCHPTDMENVQEELDKKNTQILLWQERFKEASNQANQIKMELAVAKAYIDSLPTKQEVANLKNRLITLEEEKSQLHIEHVKLKNKNLELVNGIQKIQKDLTDLQSKFEGQVLETETLKSIISLWEKRRRIAKESGHLTVEDILVEKMKFQDQFEELLTLASCREQHFKAKIDSMKMKVEDGWRAEKEAKQCGVMLRGTIDLLQEEVKEKVQQINHLLRIQDGNNNTIQKLEEKIKHLESREYLRLSSQNKIQYCLRTIAKCKKATEGIISFVQCAIDGKFRDPTLIFPPDDDPPTFVSSIGNILDEEDIEKIAKERAKEVDILRDEIEICQKLLVNKYICQLSTEMDNQCHLQ